MNNEETFYQAMRCQSTTRRSFLKYYSLAATSLGLGAGVVPEIAWALESKPRIPVVWVHGLECICYTRSFTRSACPLVKDVIFSLIFLDRDDTLMATTGTQTEEAFEGIITQYNGKYILAIESDPPLGEQGTFRIGSGRPFIKKLKRAAVGASVIIVWRTCMFWGCAQIARPNPTQTTPIDKVIADKPVIKVPGCPPTPDAMSAIITCMMTFDCLSDVDRMGRPLMFYGQRIRDRCYRRAHFDAGEFVQSRGDDAVRKGYCPYKMGCKRPTTYNACSSIHWNNGISLPIQLGHGCLGCAENSFWDHDLFYSHVVDIP